MGAVGGALREDREPLAATIARADASMYAARAAFAQKRTVYAIDLPYSGNQQLIREGAIASSPRLAPWPFGE